MNIQLRMRWIVVLMLMISLIAAAQLHAQESTPEATTDVAPESEAAAAAEVEAQSAAPEASAESTSEEVNSRGATVFTLLIGAGAVLAVGLWMATRNYAKKK